MYFQNVSDTNISKRKKNSKLASSSNSENHLAIFKKMKILYNLKSEFPAHFRAPNTKPTIQNQFKHLKP